MTEKKYTLDEIYTALNIQFAHFLSISENMSFGEKLIFEAIRKNIVDGVLARLEYDFK